MSIFEPFKLEEPNYNTINIKKVYDIFPTSLRIKQLTSQQLLEFLESQIDDRDEQIEELLRRLAELLNEGTSVDDISTNLANFTTNLEGSLNSLINDALNDTKNDTESASLRGQGYQQAGRNLFIKVETDTNVDSRFQPYQFAHNNNDEQAGSGSRITLNPSQVLLRNTGETPIQIQKLENYQEPPTSVSSGNKFPFTYTSYADPVIVNTFKHNSFSSGTGQYTFSVPVGDNPISITVEGEKTKSILDAWGLRRGSDGGKNAIAHTGELVYRNLTEGGEARFKMYYERDKD